MLEGRVGVIVLSHVGVSHHDPTTDTVEFVNTESGQFLLPTCYHHVNAA